MGGGAERGRGQSGARYLVVSLISASCSDKQSTGESRRGQGERGWMGLERLCQYRCRKTRIDVNKSVQSYVIVLYPLGARHLCAHYIHTAPATDSSADHDLFLRYSNLPCPTTGTVTTPSALVPGRLSHPRDLQWSLEVFLSIPEDRRVAQLTAI
jgi:hypothetical protein